MIVVIKHEETDLGSKEKTSGHDSYGISRRTRPYSQLLPMVVMMLHLAAITQ
jgi:hypothetical protein